MHRMFGLMAAVYLPLQPDARVQVYRLHWQRLCHGSECRTIYCAENVQGQKEAVSSVGVQGGAAGAGTRRLARGGGWAGRLPPRVVELVVNLSEPT